MVWVHRHWICLVLKKGGNAETKKGKTPAQGRLCQLFLEITSLFTPVWGGPCMSVESLHWRLKYSNFAKSQLSHWQPRFLTFAFWGLSIRENITRISIQFVQYYSRIRLSNLWISHFQFQFQNTARPIPPNTIPHILWPVFSIIS